MLLAVVLLACLAYCAPPQGVTPTWKVGTPKFTYEQFIARLGTNEKAYNGLTVQKYPAELTADLPTEFDATVEFASCMTEVRDQAECGSCWAHGAAESLSDRVCIQGVVDEPIQLAPQWLVNCDRGDLGCNGGSLPNAWGYMSIFGIVPEECTPYQGVTMDCLNACDDGSEPIFYYAHDARLFEDMESVMYDIMTNGPVETAFSVYDDFYDYESGVYQYTYGEYVGGHAIKVVGWGTDDATGLDYWKAQNSWGPDWGEDGFFRIIRGTNDCGFEGQFTAGTGSDVPFEPSVPNFGSDYYTVIQTEELGIRAGAAMYVKDGGAEFREEMYEPGAKAILVMQSGLKDGWECELSIQGGMSLCVCFEGLIPNEDILYIPPEVSYAGSRWSGEGQDNCLEEFILSDFTFEIPGLTVMNYTVANAAVEGTTYPWNVYMEELGIEVNMNVVIYEARDADSWDETLFDKPEGC